MSNIKNIFLALILSYTLGEVGMRTAAASEAAIGKAAPNFSLPGHDGKTYNLADYKGKHVVLEWYNDDCPFVVKHYKGKNMQALQKNFTEKDVIWFSIVSSAPGQQGHITADQAKELIKKHGASQTALLFDPEGTVGRAYGAQTTPHMYVINGEGNLVYMGAIDDKPSSRLSTLEGATPYLANAVNASLNGRTVDPASTKAYGCSVKYKN